MAVTPIQVAVSTSVPTLTLAAGSAGGVAAAGTIDAVNDYLLIYTNSATATQGINRNTLLGLSSAPVGLTDNQTLTNKTLTSPTIASPTFSGTIAGTYSIGGTPTFPASVVQLTGTQSITGSKTFTAATLTAPTITNATISADALTGFTVSNSGTLYGISVTTGQISTTSSVLGAALTNSSVTASKLATGATGGFTSASSTTTNTSYALLADSVSTTVTVTIGANGLALVAISAILGNSTGDDTTYMGFALSGATTQAANDNLSCQYQAFTTNTSDTRSGTFLLTGLTAGSTTFTLQYKVAASTGSAQYRRIAVVPL